MFFLIFKKTLKIKEFKRTKKLFLLLWIKNQNFDILFYNKEEIWIFMVEIFIKFLEKEKLKVY